MKLKKEHVNFFGTVVLSLISIVLLFNLINMEEEKVVNEELQNETTQVDSADTDSDHVTDVLFDE